MIVHNTAFVEVRAQKVVSLGLSGCMGRAAYFTLSDRRWIYAQQAMLTAVVI